MTKTLLSYIGRSKHIERSKITKLLFDYIYVIIDRKKFFDFTKKYTYSVQLMTNYFF